MNNKKILASFMSLAYLTCSLTGCYKPPYNDFRRDPRTIRTTTTGAAVGTGVGLISGYIIPGLGIGVAAGAAIGVWKGTTRNIIKELRKNDIEYIQYGSIHTLIIPVDKYFVFNSAELHDTQYQGLKGVIELMSRYPDSPIYVAAFSDNVGSDRHKEKMTQAQAEAMLTYLWANGFKSAQLSATGYADHYAVSDNNTVHGSAQNRRIEIQWSSCRNFVQSPVPIMADMK